MNDPQRQPIILQIVAAGLLLASLTTASARADSNWPRWRGPRCDGHVDAAMTVPVHWDPSAILWKQPLKGIGQSSPIVWGDRIFFTSALDNGRKRLVFCHDVRDGHPLWEQVAWTGEPEPTHEMNSWASATCATDGKVVVASFGRGGLHAYTVEGKHLWSRDLGKFECPWGTAACPIIFGDLVIQNGDADVDAFIAGLNKKNGETVWRTPRPNKRGWSTPIVIEAAGRTEMVLNGDQGLTAYDPASGKEIWHCQSFNGRGEPTVTPAGGLLCAVNGLKGDMYAVRLGGRGEVTATHMAWHTPRNGGRDTPSPIAIGEYILVTDMKGVLTCYDRGSGREIWKQRLFQDISSSPIAAAGLAYFQDETGQTVVIKPGPKCDIVARNSLGAEDEIFRASLAPLNGRLLARSQTALYCISGERTAAGK
jgi:outer membrane protein assembly factor BamB